MSRRSYRSFVPCLRLGLCRCARRWTPRRRYSTTAATQSTPQDDKENPVRVVEKRLEAERRLTEALRREVALLKEQERDARRECRFLPEDAPCYLMMRKIPKETVPTYLESYKNNLS